MTEHSSAFQRFTASLDAPGRAFLDRLDTAALLALEHSERIEAEDILIDALSTDDPRIVRGLEELRSVRAIVPLRAALGRARNGRMRVAIARALLDLDDDREAITTIVDVLRNGDRSSREVAASTMQTLPRADVEPHLLDALVDTDATVRGLAASALYSLHGLDDVARDYRDPLGGLRMLIASPLPSIAHQAAREIQSLIAKLDSGTSVQSLELDLAMEDTAPPVRRLMESYSDDHGLWSERLDLEDIPTTGPARRWAETMLLSWLPSDIRASRALAELRVERATSALRDLVQRADGLLAIEAAVALARIAGDERGLPRVVDHSSAGSVDRLRAVEALRYFGDDTAEAILEALQRDNDPRIRAMAAESLLHRRRPADGER